MKAPTPPRPGITPFLVASLVASALILLVIYIGIVTLTFVAWPDNEPSKKGADHPSNLPSSYDIDNPSVSDEVNVSIEETGQSSVNYTVDLVQGTKRPFERLYDQVKSFAGLPVFGQTSQTETRLDNAIVSKDRSQVVAVVGIYDITASPSVLDESLPQIDERHFLCTVSVRSCESTDLLARTNQLLQEQKIPNAYWYFWDSAENIFYGITPTGEGAFQSQIIIANLTEPTAQATADVAEETASKSTTFAPPGAFSPSLGFVALLKTDFKNLDSVPSKLYLFRTSNLLEPIGIYDLSEFEHYLDKNPLNLRAIAWHPKEKVLALANEREFWTLDLNTGKLVLLHVDTTYGAGLTRWALNELAFSPSGRYVVFVDWDGYNGAQNDDTTFNVLRTIDLEKQSNQTGQIGEVLRAKSIGLLLDY